MTDPTPEPIPPRLHSPGPWIVLELNGEVFVAAKPYPGHPYYNRTRTIQVMSDEDYPAKAADARLVATSPKMLEALDACIDLLSSLQNIGGFAGLAVVEHARSVVLEATTPSRPNSITDLT